MMEYQIVWTDGDGMVTEGEMGIEDYAADGWRVHLFQAVVLNRGFSEGVKLAFLLEREVENV